MQSPTLNHEVHANPQSLRIVITGGHGFIGVNLAMHLRTRLPNAHLTSIDLLAAQIDLSALYDTEVAGCFSAPEALKHYASADVVVHLAARTTVQESIENPLATFEENVAKTQRMLEHIRVHAPASKIVFASTGGAIVGDYDGAIHEKLCARPLSPYGASKLAVEGLLSAYQGSFGLRSAALRFSNVYGPNSYRKGSVVAAFCKQIARNNTVQVNGDGEQTRDYIYVTDIAEAITRVIETPDACGVFQLGTGVETSINTLVSIFKSLCTGNPPSVVKAPALPGEVRHNRCDISRIRSELGFSPIWSLEQGIAATREWFAAEAQAGRKRARVNLCKLGSKEHSR